MERSELQVSTIELMGPRLLQLQQWALAALALGAVLCVIGAIVDPKLFPADPKLFPDSRVAVFHSYLYAYLFLLGATNGSLGFLMVHHVTGGGWGYVIRRFLEAATRLLPLMMVLFIPIIIGLLAFGLYPWWGAGASANPVVQAKAAYLNAPFFIGRAVFYFAVWMVLAYFLNTWGATQNERGDLDITRRLNYLSAAGILIYVLTTTWASIDWVMSLTPTWYSSIFGLLVVVSQGITSLAVMLCLVRYLLADLPLLKEVPSGYFRDLGNLLLTTVMLWAYMSFSQYMLTFTADKSDEVIWYSDRAHNFWGLVSLFLIPMHFFLPFAVLLVGSGIKRDPIKLSHVALYILAMRLVDLFWWVTPTFRKHLSLSVADVGAPLLLGGIWLWAWAGQMQAKPVPMVPVHDPRLEGHLQEAVSHG
jgi:hypothetical protein